MHAIGQPINAKDAYDLCAGSYDDWHWQKTWRLVERPWVARMLCRSAPGHCAIDAGCGTGSYLSMLLARYRVVHGVDVSTRMLDIASRCGATLHNADLRALPVATGQADLVTTTRALSHVRDVDAALREFRRVIKSGGYLIYTDVHPDHAYEYTRLPAHSTRVTVETFKHRVADTVLQARDVGFRLRCAEALALDRKPPVGVALLFERQ